MKHRTWFTSFLELSLQVTPLGWLKMIEMYSFTVLEARSLKSRCWQGPALCEENRWSFLALSWLLAFVEASLPSLSLLSYEVLLCVSPNSPLLKRTAVILAQGPATWPHFALTTSKSHFHILRSWGLGLRQTGWRGHRLAHNRIPMFLDNFCTSRHSLVLLIEKAFLQYAFFKKSNSLDSFLWSA